LNSWTDRAFVPLKLNPGVSEHIRLLGNEVAALLVEARTESSDRLADRIEAITKILTSCELLAPVSFTEDKQQSKKLWEIRKALFPSWGFARQSGTTIINRRLADAAVDLRSVLHKRG
jgi:hypothetical protein